MKRGPNKRSADRLKTITKAASREIVLRGYDNLSVGDIAEAAGMSVGGIYRYIKTKTDLLVMVCEGIYDGVREELGEIVASDAVYDVKLASAVDHYLVICENRRAEITMVYREYRQLPAEAQQHFMQREQAIADLFADLLRAGMRAGAFRGVDATLLAIDIVFLGHLPSFKGWALRGAGTTPNALRSEQVDLILSRVVDGYSAGPPACDTDPGAPQATISTTMPTVHAVAPTPTPPTAPTPSLAEGPLPAQPAGDQLPVAGPEASSPSPTHPSTPTPDLHGQRI